MNAATKKALEQLRLQGPTRVVIQRDGYAVNYRRAQGQGVNVDVVFVRNDGWTLGAPTEYEQVAYKLWPTEWVGYMRYGMDYQPISEYSAGGL